MADAAGKETATEFLDDESKCLKYEQFIAKVMSIRKGDERPKQKWQLILESAGGAALITVVIGGLLVSLITGCYQSKQAEIERERAARAKLQELRFQSTTDALLFVSNTIAAADDLLETSTEGFAKAPESQRSHITNDFIAADAGWRKQSRIFDFRLNYYFRDNPSVVTSWRTTGKNLSLFLECASDWAEKHPQYTRGLKNDCQLKRNAVADALDNLQKSLPAIVQ